MNVRVYVDVPLARFKEKEAYVERFVKGGARDYVQKALRRTINDLLFEKFLEITDKDFAVASEPYIQEAIEGYEERKKRARERNALRKQEQLP